ncbi:MAG: methyltransferase domain-containing protein [Elusimicrobiota bacterium]
MNKKIYLFYILLGLLCPIVMGTYYINGEICCIDAVYFEVIVGILSSSAAILAFTEYKREKELGLRLCFLIPVIVIILIPVFMINKVGFSTFLTEKMRPFLIMEGFAVAQFVLAILMFRGLVFKRGEDKLMPNIGFRIMSLVLRIRDIFRNPERTLKEVGLKKGQSVLDYGCGIGSFTLPAAKIVGENGMVYALDIHPLAIKTIERIIKGRGISNIKTILSNIDTGLRNESVDIVLLYDTFHMVKDKEGLLKELHRVLKSGGILSINAEHMEEDEFLNILTKANLFSLVKQKEKLFKFKKEGFK